MKKELTIRQVKCDKFIARIQDLIDLGLPKTAGLYLAKVMMKKEDFRPLEEFYIAEKLKEVQE